MEQIANPGCLSAYAGMKFPAKLVKLIADRDTSQARLTRQTGISQSAISEMTMGKRRPYMDQALLLARALNVPLDYLADDGQDEPPRQGLTEEERSVLKVFRALRLDEEEALRRLYGVSGSSRSGGQTSGSIRDETALELRIQQQLQEGSKRGRRGKRSVEDRDENEGAKPDRPNKRIR